MFVWQKSTEKNRLDGKTMKREEREYICVNNFKRIDVSSREKKTKMRVNFWGNVSRKKLRRIDIGCC